MLMVQGSVISINFSGNAHSGWKVIDKYDKKNSRAVATKKKLVRPKYEECEKKDDGKSCEARQAVRSTAFFQLGV